MGLSQQFSDPKAFFGILRVNNIFVAQNKFFQRCFQLFGAQFENPGFDLSGRTQGRVSGHEGCAAGMRPHIPGANVRI